MEGEQHEDSEGKEGHHVEDQVEEDQQRVSDEALHLDHRQGHADQPQLAVDVAAHGGTRSPVRQRLQMGQRRLDIL